MAEGVRTRFTTAIALNRQWSAWPRSFGLFMARLDRANTPYLSHSKVSLIERCPGCYYRQYVLGEPPESQALLLGTLFHKAAKTLYASKTPVTVARLTARTRTGPLESDRRKRLQNALRLLLENRWSDYHTAVVEEPFFMDLGTGLPPVIGVPDLVLVNGRTLTVVDHKTSARFNELDAGQLVLYAESLRRTHKGCALVGYFDQYRLVPNLATIRKPAFQRTRIPVDRKLLPALIKRYSRAWKAIASLDPREPPEPSLDCWACNSQIRAY